MTELSTAVHSLDRKFESRINALSTHLTERNPTDAAQPDMPPADALPDFEPQNPWRSARYAPFSGSMLTIEGVGTRPISDFERHPPEAELPFCFVRLSQEASIREDRVPRETVIYPQGACPELLNAGNEGGGVYQLPPSTIQGQSDYVSD